MWELDCEEGWAPKNWCFWTVVLEKTLESPLDYKEIQLVYSKGDQPWVFFGRKDAKAETPVLWPPHGKSWLIGKDSDAGRDWGQEEKGMTEDEMAGWHHRLNGRESEWTPNSWDCKESDTTEQLNWTELKEFPGSSAGKESACNAGRRQFDSCVRKIPGEGIGYPLQDILASLVAQTVKNASGRPGFDPWVGKIPWRRAWRPTPVFCPGDFPWTEEPGRLQSMKSGRVRQDWAQQST